MFKPGDEVVPCNKSWTDELLSGAGLVRGGVYVVEKYWVEDCWLFGLTPSILLAGIDMPKDCNGCSPVGFKAQWFRKVQKRSTETGMAILKKIADKPNIKIKEDA